MATKYPTFSQGVESAISEFKKHLGRNEYPAGSNRTAYGKAYGFDGVPYCAIAIKAVTDIWGISGSALVKSASSSAIQRWHRLAGRNVSTPQRGDLIHLYKNGKSVHVEMVLSYKNGKLICIGANTSNAGQGSTADGGGTYINDRTSWWRNRNSNRGYSIKGVSRPFYGLKTSHLKELQTKLGVKADGVMGPGTISAIKKAQKDAGLKVDGFPGPNTLSTLLDGATAVIDKTSVKPVEKPAAKPKGLTVDGRFGTSTAKALQQWLNAKHGASLKVDGKAGRSTWSALQKALRTPVDGMVSHQSYKASELGNGITQGWQYSGRGAKGSTMVKALQKLIGAKVDGIWGEGTTKHLQQYLNGQS